MATITDWIKHITTDTDGAEVGTQVGGAIYPMVGTEGILVIILLVIWIGWHVLANMSESEELEKLARKKYSANDHKSNITEW
tara:strand:+ start:264 stop:509 length:246 start_codon:yes stop_codon:yes gene_type:complete